MSATRFVRSFGHSGAAFALVALAASVASMGACDSSDDGAPTGAAAADGGDDTLGDDDATTPYTGPTQGGTIVTPSEDGSLGAVPEMQDAPSGSVDVSCCNVTFTYDPSHFAADDAGAMSLPDAGDAGDADDASDAADAGDSGEAGAPAPAPTPAPTAVSLVGDAYPLQNGAMVSMIQSTNGTWTVSLCIPHDEYLRYRFYLGSAPLDPSMPDAGSVADIVCDPTLSTVSDGFGSCYDTFGPVTTCSAIDASTGSLANDP